MAINSMFVYHFVDHDLRAETFFKRDEAAGVDFKVGDIDISVHLY